MQDNYQDNPNRKNNVRNNGGGNKTARRAAPQGTAPRQRQMQHQGEAPRRRASQTQGEEPRRRKVQYMDEGDMQADMPMQHQGEAPRRRQTAPNGRSASGAQGQKRKSSQNPNGQARRQAPGNKKKNTASKKNNKKKPQELTPQQAAKKKRRRILLFIGEIFLLLILVIVVWGASKTSKIVRVEIPEDEIGISEQVQQSTEQGVMKGYRNVALFGVDSREGELDKNTRSDTMIIASINLDTNEVKMVSVYRDTWLNLSTDSYNKANAAYAKGGPKQAIAMLNMNLDMNITDFVTVGFDGLMDVIDAVGGVEIDVKEAEIVHLNSFQISMAGRPDGTLNAAGEPNYTATAGVDYTPVTKSGVQTLNGLQATAYCRIRYVGNDFERTSRQRTVVTQIAKKAMTLNPARLNAIAEAVFPKIATSLDMSEILSLLSGIASYQIGDTTGFPFDEHYVGTRVGQASVIAPADLEQNVILLHRFLFGDSEEYVPSDTVKKCSQKIASDTKVSAKS